MNLQRNIVMLLLPCSPVGRPGDRACRADDSALAESRVRCVYNPGKDRGLALRFGRN